MGSHRKKVADHTQEMGTSKTSNINDKRSPHSPSEHKAHNVVKSKAD